jgi:MFS family permease
MAHLVIMNTWGFINSFGVFQAYYVTALNKSPSDISWVGSIQVFLLFFIGTFTGRFTDAGYFRLVFLTGTLVAIIGVFMTSLSTKYWQLFLAQGVCCGIGYGCLFCPALSLLSTYFSKKRSLAIGFATSGSATGGMIFPAMVKQLLPRIGFPWTMRAMAFIQLGCFCLCNIGLKPRVPPRKTGALVDWASFKEAPYVLFATGMFFVSSSSSAPNRIGVLIRWTEFLGHLLCILLPDIFWPLDNPPSIFRLHQPPYNHERSWSPGSHHP